MIHSLRIPFSKPRGDDDDDDDDAGLPPPSRGNRASLVSRFPVAALSPTMDLLALGHSSVTVNRSIEWERVFAHNGNATTVTAMTFRPDGKVLAVAFENGEIYLLGIENAVDDRRRRRLPPRLAELNNKSLTDTDHIPSTTSSSSNENLEVVIESSSTSLPSRKVTFLHWTAARSGRRSPFPPPIAWSSAPMSYASELFEGPALDLLLACDDGGVVTLRTYFDFAVGCTDLRGCFPSSSSTIPVTAVMARLSPRLGYMVAIMEREPGERKLVTVDTSIIRRRRSEIALMSSKLSPISPLLESALLAVQRCVRIWQEEIDAPMKKHFAPLVEACAKPATEPSAFSSRTPNEELLDLYTSGLNPHASSLRNYLKLSANQLVWGRWRRTVEGAYATIRETLVEEVQVPVATALERLAEMHALCSVPSSAWKYEQIGVTPDSLIPHLATLERLLLDLAIFLDTRVDTPRREFAAFAEWIKHHATRHLLFAPPASATAASAAATTAVSREHEATVETMLRSRGILSRLRNVSLCQGLGGTYVKSLVREQLVASLPSFDRSAAALESLAFRDDENEFELGYLEEERWLDRGRRHQDKGKIIPPLRTLQMAIEEWKAKLPTVSTRISASFRPRSPIVDLPPSPTPPTIGIDDEHLFVAHTYARGNGFVLIIDALAESDEERVPEPGEEEVGAPWVSQTYPLRPGDSISRMCFLEASPGRKSAFASLLKDACLLAASVDRGGGDANAAPRSELLILRFQNVEREETEEDMETTPREEALDATMTREPSISNTFSSRLVIWQKRRLRRGTRHGVRSLVCSGTRGVGVVLYDTWRMHVFDLVNNDDEDADEGQEMGG